LGGDSLLATRFISLLKGFPELENMDFPLSVFFDNPKIENVVNYIYLYLNKYNEVDDMQEVIEEGYL
jgi:hypothetical protein